MMIMDRDRSETEAFIITTGEGFWFRFREGKICVSGHRYSIIKYRIHNEMKRSDRTIRMAKNFKDENLC